MWMTDDALRDLKTERDTLEQTGQLTQQQQVRLLQLRQLIAHADTTRKPDDGLVEPGMRITVQFEDLDVESFVLSDHLIDNERVVSPLSPIGKALNGTHVDDTITFTTPTGNTQTITVLAASPHPRS